MNDEKWVRPDLWAQVLWKSMDAGMTGSLAASEGDMVLANFDRQFPELAPVLDKTGQGSQQEQIETLERQKDGAYFERNQCVALIARMAQRLGHRVGVARTAIDGWSPDWHGCVYMQLPTGQVSWHFHDSQAHLFADLPAWQEAWDGHSTEEKYRRVNLAFAGNASGPGNRAPTLRLEHNGVDVWSCSGPDEDVWKSLAIFARAQYMTTEQQQEVHRAEERVLAKTTLQAVPEWPFAKGDRVRTANAGGLGVVADQMHEEGDLVSVKVWWMHSPMTPFCPHGESVSWVDSQYLTKVGT